MQPKSFQELRSLIQNNELKNGRSVGNQKLYESYIEHVPPKHRDTILEIQQAENQVKYSIFKSSWTVNCFSYNKTLEYLPNVKHCNIWVKSWHISNQDLENEINLWLKTMYGCVLEYCYFVNEPKNRSIAHKPHAHVFVNFENYKL
jgi:hypothetical protein